MGSAILLYDHLAWPGQSGECRACKDMLNLVVGGKGAKVTEVYPNN
jgi:hypothetical protein